MVELHDRKWSAKKLNFQAFSNNKEINEELTYKDVTRLMMSGGFMTMLKRMGVGEILFYNENNIEFQRIE